MRYIQGTLVAAAAMLLAGCFNIGTKSSEITPAYVPASKYAGETCRQLDVERQDLYQRKSMLESAQDQRRHSNKVQAFWVGFGNGDGVGASELAQVKGDVLAVEKARALKGCNGGAPVEAAASPATAPTENGRWPLALPQFDIQGNCQRHSADVQGCINAEQSARLWLAHHSATVQVAGQCSQFAGQDQSYAMIQSCVQQREGGAR